MTESLLLAALATLLAVPLVSGVSRFLPLLVPYPLSISTAPDPRVFAFLALVGLGAGLLFGMVPAWAASRGDVAGALRDGRRQGSRGRTRLLDGLVVAQLALSLGLVAGAALLGRSVANARSAEPGFDPARLVVGNVDLESTGRYDADQGRELYRLVLDEVRRIPGVTGATLANQAPIHGGHSRAGVRPEDQPDLSFEAEYIQVAEDYFETLGISILEGEPLTGYAPEGDPVVVVNEALAALFWPGRSALGQRLSGPGGSLRVVGVANDVQMRSLRSAANPAVYYPVSQSYPSRAVLHVRSGGGAGALLPALRGAVAAVDPELPVLGVTDLTDALAASMGETRTIGRLVAVLAALALLLAAVGLYGVVSFTVAQRVREMGIRMALGAAPAGLVRMVLRRGLGLTVLGTLAGFGVAAVVGRSLESTLFGVGSGDPAALAFAAAALLTVSTLAAWIPARRASRVDAAVSLREE
jgi:predicted permease